MAADARFDGCIAGLGTAGGLRVVVGHWPHSPFGPFADVMVEHPDGRRMLLAPTREVAEFVAGTYRFDEVRVVAVTVVVEAAVVEAATCRRRRGDRRSGTAGRAGGGSASRNGDHGQAARTRWRVAAGPLALSFDVGRRAPLGWLLRAVPRRLATAPWWVGAVDVVARRVLPGVRTTGSAGNGRTEYYAALDLHRVTAATLTWDGADQGALAPVDPPVRFGFGSTPRAPSLARIVTLVRE
ncbi:MAG: hypothetical protein ACT4RN_12625 [Pseudonocardia sp.]